MPKVDGGDVANVATRTANKRRGRRCYGFGSADFVVVSAAPEDMRRGARQASTDRRPLRGYSTIPARRFFRIPLFSPLAGGVEDRSIA
jgi:hypothetical protein